LSEKKKCEGIFHPSSFKIEIEKSRLKEHLSPIARERERERI
jgi:hypothetical protein